MRTECAAAARSLFFYTVFQLTSDEEKERRRERNVFYGTFVSRIYFASSTTVKYGLLGAVGRSTQSTKRMG